MADDDSSLTCASCGNPKQATNFYCEPNGRRWKQCRECVRKRRQAYRETPKAKELLRAASKRHRSTSSFRARRRQHDKQRYATDQAYRARILAQCSEYTTTIAGRLSRQRATQKYVASNPDKVAARSAVNHAIEAKRLREPESLPCRYCGGLACEYHHHRGYAPEHWLDVVATCKPCHLLAEHDA